MPTVTRDVDSGTRRPNVDDRDPSNERGPAFLKESESGIMNHVHLGEVTPAPTRFAHRKIANKLCRIGTGRPSKA